MKTKQLLICLAFLIIGFVANVNAQHVEQKRINKYPDVEKQTDIMQRSIKHSLGARAAHYTFPVQAKEVTPKGEEGRKAYGFRLYDEVEWPYLGIVQFGIENPEQITVVFEKDYNIRAGAYAKGKYYVCKMNEYDELSSLSNIDLHTGDETFIADISQLASPKSMTYDYSTGTMYMLQWKKIVPISLLDGTVGEGISISADLISIACSYDGRIYGIITETAELAEVDKSSGKLRIIGKTGQYVENMIQSMDFDHHTNTLYWAGYSGEGFLATLDLQTGMAKRIGTLGNNSEIAGLYIPFSICHADAPDEVSDLNVEPDRNGALRVNLSWRNPEKTYGGAKLNELTGIKIYRDGTLVAQLTPAIAGTLQTYADQQPTNGKVQYKIVPYNSVGDGAPKYSNVYVGEDYPSEITGLKLAKDGQNAALTWTLSATGANNGWLNLSSIRYKITRYPDETILENEYSEGNSYIDSTIKGLNVYYYTVEAFNSVGGTEPFISNNLTFGSKIIPPYICDFSTEDHFNLWQIIDQNNDQNSWFYDSWEGLAKYNASEKNEANDWLISSPAQLEAGKYYKLTIDLGKAADWMESYESIRVTMGTGATVDMQTILLADYPDFSAGLRNIHLKVDETGVYYIGIHCYSPKNNIFSTIKSVKLTIAELVDISVASVYLGDSIAPANSPRVYTVRVENKGATVIPEYTVELMDEDRNSICTQIVQNPLAPGATEDIQISYHPNRECSMTIYARIIAVDDLNLENNITPEGIKVLFKKAYTVSGKITDKENTSISGAMLKMVGFRTLITETEEDGTFILNDVYSSPEAYELTVLKNGFTTTKQHIFVNDANVELSAFKLDYRLIAPVDVKVKQSQSGKEITWADGVNVQKFRYDNDMVGGGFGPLIGSKRGVVGVVYEQPTRLTGMSWVMENTYSKNETANLFVLALDNNGKPTSEILFSQSNVANTNSEWQEEVYWNSFTFPSPIDAPRGCFVAVGSDNPGFGVYVDDLSYRDEYPFIPQTQYTTDDYTGNLFTPIEEAFYPVNFFIRAEGIPIGSNPATKYIKGYRVWRFVSGNEENISSWTELTTTIQTTTTLSDKAWQNVAQGVYRYAVRTEYNDGKLSGYAFSQEVEKNMYSTVSISAKTNTPNNEIEGAKVILKNIENQKRHEVYLDNSGITNFSNVWKGTYTLQVKKNGFDLLEEDRIEIGNQGNKYELGPYTLKESILRPYNLNITGQPSEKSSTLNWNLFQPIKDDFESHEDFEINSQGKVGWQYFDGDDAYTYALGDGTTVYFPNQCKKMAYIIFNPSMSTPPLTGPSYDPIQPYSGDKFLAFISSSNQLKASNDYLISPELCFEDDFKFLFYARSCDVGVSPEQIRVGYSVTGTDQKDFIWFNDEKPMEVPYDWSDYEFDIPSAAKYVAINYVSYDLFMLMIDNVFIGYNEPAVRNTGLVEIKPGMRDHKCEIYLDGNKVSETKGYNYTFSNLSENNKTVGVRTVYSSGSSDIITIGLDGSSIENSKIEKLQVYLDPIEKRIYIKGDYEWSELFDASGKLLSKQEYSDEINVNTLPAGIYIFKAHAQDYMSTHKISIGR